jgi:hypothetical protein
MMQGFTALVLLLNSGTLGKVLRPFSYLGVVDIDQYDLPFLCSHKFPLCINARLDGTQVCLTLKFALLHSCSITDHLLISLELWTPALQQKEQDTTSKWISLYRFEHGPSDTFRKSRRSRLLISKSNAEWKQCLRQSI